MENIFALGWLLDILKVIFQCALVRILENYVERPMILIAPVKVDDVAVHCPIIFNISVSFDLSFVLGLVVAGMKSFDNVGSGTSIRGLCIMLAMLVRWRNKNWRVLPLESHL